MIIVCIHCGPRMRSELLTLKWDNLDLGRKTLTVIGAYAKNGKVRVVPLNSTVLAALERHPHPPKAEWVFTTPSGLPYKSVRGFNAACERAGLKGRDAPHLAPYVCDPLNRVRGGPHHGHEAGGVSSIKMIDRYAHSDPSRMAKAVEGLARNSRTGTGPSKIRSIVKTA